MGLLHDHHQKAINCYSTNRLLCLVCFDINTKQLVKKTETPMKINVNKVNL